MGNPKVTIKLNSSNLGIQPADQSGVMGIIASVAAANTSGLGVPVILKSKAAAALELADPENAALLGAIQNGFFGEVSEGAPLYCIFLINTTTLSTMADIANPYVKNLWNFSNKTIRAIAFVEYPAGSYAPTITHGLDEDVHAAVIKAQAQAAYYLSLYKQVEFLIQGYGATNATDALDYSTAANNNVHIVIANEAGDTVIPLLRALGRKASDRPSRNIGRILSGSLNIPTGTVITIGSNALNTIDPTDLDTYHDKGYITYLINENAPGWVFSDDVSLCNPTSDYSTWANNATIGEAIRLAYSTYYKTLKDDVEVDATTGRMDVSLEKNLSQQIEDAITQNIGSSISAVNAMVNPDTTQYAALYNAAGFDEPNLNLTAAGQVYVFLTITPKGYIKDVMVALGFGLNS